MSDDAPADSASVDPSNSDSSSLSTSKRIPLNGKGIVNIAILPIILILIAVVLNLPYKAADTVGTFYGNEERFFNLAHTPVPPTFTTAGWPTEYALRVDYQDAAPMSLISYSRLAINVALVSFVAGIVALYRWHKSTLATAVQSNKIKLSLSDILVLIAVCWGGLIYWQILNKRSSNAHELANRIFQQQGSAHVAPVVPALLAEKLPDFALRWFDRIVSAELNSPDNDILKEVIAQPYLQKLSVTGNSFEIEHLTPVTKKPRLWSLRLSGRKLTTSDELQFIGTMSQLSELNVMRTSITSAAVNQWKGLSRIRFMNLIHTDLLLSELTAPPWANQIETLYLPRPPRGVSDSLEIRGWEKLRILYFLEFEELLNDSVVTVTLDNLPALEAVQFEQFQKFDISISNAPNLKSIYSGLHLNIDDNQWQARLTDSEVGPLHLWARELKIENTPNLDNIPLFARDLEKCDLRGMSPELTVQLEAKSYCKQLFRVSGRAPMPLSKRNLALQTIAKSEQLGHLVLNDFDTTGVNFEVFRECPSLEKLSLMRCYIDKVQLLQLAGNSSLKTLDLGNTVLDGPTLNFVLKRLPNLESVQLQNGESINSLRLEGHSMSKLMSTEGLFDLDALRLIDLPHFGPILGLKHPVKHLHVTNVPQLKGIIANGPIPSDSLIELGESTEVLGLGGEHVSDERLRSFAQMPKLRKLSLVDTKLSAERMSEIGGLAELTSVVLAGDNVTDAVVSRLSNLKNLTRLEVATSQTISGQSLQGLGSLENLRFLTLRLGDTEITNYEWLAKLERLEMIRIDGWRCDPGLINALAQLENLACLGLEGMVLTKENLGSLTATLGNGLSRLSLQRSQIDGDGLIAFMKQRTSVTLELRDANVEVAALERAMNENRLFTDYLDESPEFNVDAKSASFDRATNGRKARLIAGDWDVFDKQTLDPKIFRLFRQSSPSKDKARREAQSKRKLDSGTNALEKQPASSEKSEFLDMIDQIRK